MSLFNQGEKAYLLLADGTILEGIHFGVKGTAIGEVVFTTGMTAYQYGNGAIPRRTSEWKAM